MDLPAPAWPLYGYHVDGMAKLFGAHRCRHNDHHTLRVGLCWRGDPQNPNDRRRSVDWPVFEPLLRVAGCQFVSLQQQAADHPELEQPSLTDWNATAAVIAGLDLVITVDTSIGHLAGSMGVPTWILVEPNGDWRWRSDMPGTTPWYPSDACSGTHPATHGPRCSKGSGRRWRFAFVKPARVERFRPDGDRISQGTRTDLDEHRTNSPKLRSGTSHATLLRRLARHAPDTLAAYEQGRN